MLLLLLLVALAAQSHARRLLAGAVDAAVEPPSPPTPPPLLVQALQDVLLPRSLSEGLSFSRLENLVLTEEAIQISDQSYSFVTSQAVGTDSNAITVAPVDLFDDAAAGFVLIIGVSSLFYVVNASLLEQGLPLLGINIPITSAQALVNLPGYFIGGGYTQSGSGPRRGLGEEPAVPSCGLPSHAQSRDAPPLRRQLLTKEEAAALSPDFWDSLLEVLPPAARSQLERAITERMLPILAQRNVTVLAPIAPLNLFFNGLFVSLLDIEVSLRTLQISNQRALSTRAGPTLRLASDGTIAEGVQAQGVASAFITQTVQQLAAAAAAQLNLTVAQARGDAAGASSQASALAEDKNAYLHTQLGVLPLTATLRFDLLLRLQLTVNGGDVASVV